MAERDWSKRDPAMRNPFATASSAPDGPAGMDLNVRPVIDHRGMAPAPRQPPMTAADWFAQRALRAGPAAGAAYPQPGAWPMPQPLQGQALHDAWARHLQRHPIAMGGGSGSTGAGGGLLGVQSPLAGGLLGQATGWPGAARNSGGPGAIGASGSPWARR